jgi:hypothetical protein
MGYRIESYSLSELHRISVPAEVPPTLFWTLPVGHWRRGELDRLWRWFTKGPTRCNHFGLLLVKDSGEPESAQSNLSLASVGAKLSDLMPTGAERFSNRSAYLDGTARLLMLSGAYPQPGWGVLVEWQPEIGDVESFVEELITRTIAGLHADEKLKVFMEAAASFRRWRALREAATDPTKKDLYSTGSS